MAPISVILFPNKSRGLVSCMIITVYIMREGFILELFSRQAYIVKYRIKLLWDINIGGHDPFYPCVLPHPRTPTHPIIYFLFATVTRLMYFGRKQKLMEACSNIVIHSKVYRNAGGTRKKICSKTERLKTMSGGKI